MSFLKRAIERGIGNAIGKAVQQAVEPKATDLANRAARQLDRAAGTAPQARQDTAGSLKGAFSDLERAAQGYATEMSKNLKICPECNQPARADEKFCSSCGCRLPEKTLSEEAVCPSCGRQNNLTARFCAECGEKLPAAIAQENAAQARDAAVLEYWDEALYEYPKWNSGGYSYELEARSEGYVFSACFKTHQEARHAVVRYCDMLVENGFYPAGRYPSDDHLYKMVEGVCLHVDAEHCFDGDPDRPMLYFDHSEPHGGYDYDPSQQDTGNINLKDVFNLFK